MNTHMFLTTIVPIGAWFFFNLSLANVMKWIYLYGEICLDGECHKYEFPFFITTAHMALSSVVGFFTPVTRAPPQRHVILLALLFAISVCAGNGSLVNIYPSFKEMISTLTPFATMFFVVAFTDTRYNSWAYISVPIMCAGTLLCAKEEVVFSLLGAFMSLMATFTRGAKTAVQGVVLANHKVDSVTLVAYMAPWCMAFSLLASLAFEGREPWRLLVQGDIDTVLPCIFLVFLSSINAYWLNVSNFAVTKAVGPLSLQVMGIVKSVMAILGSMLVFGNVVTSWQAMGTCISITGIVLYQQKGEAHRRRKERGKW